MNNKIKRLLKLVESGIEAVNAKIEAIEKITIADIEIIEQSAKNLGLKIDSREDRNIRDRILSEIGLYPDYSYTPEFREVTAKFSGNHTFFYCVRDSIGNYYGIKNARINKNFVKMSTMNYVVESDKHIFKTIEEFQNGNSNYEKTPELMQMIEDVKKIDQIFTDIFYKK